MSYPKVQHLEAVNLIKRDPNPLGIISCLSLIKRDGSCGNDGSSYIHTCAIVRACRFHDASLTLSMKEGFEGLHGLKKSSLHSQSKSN